MTQVVVTAGSAFDEIEELSETVVYRDDGGKEARSTFDVEYGKQTDVVVKNLSIPASISMVFSGGNKKLATLAVTLQSLPHKVETKIDNYEHTIDIK